MAPSMQALREEARRDIQRWGSERRRSKNRQLLADGVRLAYLVLRIEQSAECPIPEDDDDWCLVRDAVAYWPERGLLDRLTVQRYLDAYRAHVEMLEWSSEQLDSLFPKERGAHTNPDEEEEPENN